jgi:hypothetical protein
MILAAVTPQRPETQLSVSDRTFTRRFASLIGQLAITQIPY